MLTVLLIFVLPCRAGTQPVTREIRFFRDFEERVD